MLAIADTSTNSPTSVIETIRGEGSQPGAERALVALAGRVGAARTSGGACTHSRENGFGPADCGPESDPDLRGTLMRNRQCPSAALHRNGGLTQRACGF
ncbi:MAG TPA: hypothetical protein PK691_03765 [Thermomicrobiales bacterium]|nr:hypothetical protein [Thermomicrobiales bacterium]